MTYVVDGIVDAHTADLKALTTATATTALTCERDNIALDVHVTWCRLPTLVGVMIYVAGWGSQALQRNAGLFMVHSTLRKDLAASVAS